MAPPSNLFEKEYYNDQLELAKMLRDGIKKKRKEKMKVSQKEDGMTSLAFQKKLVKKYLRKQRCLAEQKTYMQRCGELVKQAHQKKGCTLVQKVLAEHKAAWRNEEAWHKRTARSKKSNEEASQ